MKIKLVNHSLEMKLNITYNKYMSVPNLDFLYNNVSPEEFEKILSSVNHENNTLFFALYKNAPESLKPSLKEENNFVSLLCSRVESLPEEEFNHWFFDKNLKKFSNLHDIKKLIEKKPQNKKLKELLEVEDKPKNTSDLLTSLWYNKSRDIDKYYGFIQLYKKNLIEINNKKLTAKSAIGNILFRWMDKLDYDEKMKLAKDLHLDILHIAYNSEKNLHIDIQKISLKDLKEVWDKIPSSHENYKLSKIEDNFFIYKNSSTGFWDKLFDILDDNTNPERKEKSQFMFNNILDHFEKRLKVKKDQIKVNLLELLVNPQQKDLRSFLGNMLEKSRGDSGYSYKFIEKIEQHNEDFFCLINPIYANLNESLKEKFVSKKIKI